MNKILVPSDLSKLSENALKLAVQIAEKSKGEIRLVNFQKHPYGKTFSAIGEMESKVSEEENIFTLKLIKKNFARLKEMSDRHTSASVSINHEVYDEDFDDGIEAYITDNNIDLVVLGTTGEENAEEFFTGNHAQQVIEHAPCPVITVRQDDILGDFSNLVLGVDFDKDGDDNFVKAVSLVNDLSTMLKSKVHLIHVTDEQNEIPEARENLENFAKNYGLVNYTTEVVQADDDLSGLVSYGHKIKAGAVAVLTHADGGFFRAFEHNMSEELNKESDIPVLTINLHRI